jgi:hypothetical protein
MQPVSNIYGPSKTLSIPPLKLKTLEEAATFQMPVQLRQLFVDICLYCNPTNALQLFELNLPHLMEDYVRSGHEEEVAKNLTLKWIQDKLLLNNQLMENFSLPVPDFHLINQLIQAQIAADNDEVDTHEKRLLGQMMLEKSQRWSTSSL